MVTDNDDRDADNGDQGEDEIAHRVSSRAESQEQHSAHDSNDGECLLLGELRRGDGGCGP